MPRLLAASLGALLIAGCALPPLPVRPVTPTPFVPQPVVRDGPCDPLCIRRLSSAALPRWR